MFKKPGDLQERSKTLLKNKDVRSLKETILKNMSSIDTTELIGNGKGSVTVTKLADRTLLYSVNGIVLFFDVNARNQIYPTIYTLSKYPQSLRHIVIHSPVSSYLLRGADLMLPGLATVSGLEGLQVREKVCIRIVGNPIPFAVGESICSYEGILANNRKGRGFAILHIFKDELWKTSGSIIPNDGFGDDMIYSIEKENIGSMYGDDDHNHGIDDDDDDDDDNHDEGEDEEEEEKEEEIVQSLQNTHLSESFVEEKDANVDAEDDSDPSVSLEDWKVFFLRYTLRTIKYIIKERQLPLLVSAFWTLVTRCIRRDTTNISSTSSSITMIGISGLDREKLENFTLKNTKFKKVNTFLMWLEEHGILKTTNVNGVSSVTAIEKNHDWMKEHSQYIAVSDPDTLRAFCDNAAGSSDVLTSATNASNSNDKKNCKKNRVAAIDLYKFPKDAKSLFGTMKGEFGETLQANEVRSLLFQYVSAKSLEDPKDKSKVIIPRNDALNKFVFGKRKKGDHSQSTSTLTSSMRNSNVNSSNCGKINDSKGSKGGIQWREELAEVREVSRYDHSHVPTTYDAFMDEYPIMDNHISTDTNYGYGNNYDNDEQMMTEEEAARQEMERMSHMREKNLSWMNTGAAKGIESSINDGGKKANVWTRMNYNSNNKINNNSNNKNKNAWYDNDDNNNTIRNNNNTIKNNNNNNTSKQENDSNVIMEESVDDVISKEELIKKVLGKLSAYHVMFVPGQNPQVKSGDIPRLYIEVASRMGNKVVTILRGIENFGLGGKQIASEFQKKFACSASYGTSVATPSMKEVSVQGNLMNEMISYLEKEHGLPSKLIDTKIGKGVKSKKRS